MSIKLKDIIFSTKVDLILVKTLSEKCYWFNFTYSHYDYPEQPVITDLTFEKMKLLESEVVEIKDLKDGCIPLIRVSDSTTTS